MPDLKTYWAILNDTPTECTVEASLYSGILVVRPVDNPKDCSFQVRKDFVHENKKSCIHNALEILARYYSDGERDIKDRMMQQAQLFNKMQMLQKALEECDAKG